jgi:hypothetical protein
MPGGGSVLLKFGFLERRTLGTGAAVSENAQIRSLEEGFIDV